MQVRSVTQSPAMLNPVATAPGSVFFDPQWKGHDLIRKAVDLRPVDRERSFLFTIYYLRFTIARFTICSMEEREEFLTARQLAKVLQVSESTVRRLARKRRIPSVRVTPHIIRFHLDAVREALDVPRRRIRHGEFTEPVDDSQLSFDDLLALS